MPFNPNKAIAEIGEKKIIRDFLRPLFDGDHQKPFLGNDCAVLVVGAEKDVVLSTDRVPADLIAFRKGIIDYGGLGRYLAVLNLSDIAASGGVPLGLMLNLGMPDQLLFKDLRMFCVEFKRAVEKVNARIVGGDITSSGEFSASATSIGVVPKGRALSRSGAKPGDYIFVSNPLGITPAAFMCVLELGWSQELLRYKSSLMDVFARPEAQIPLGVELRASGLCTACMDNTDGYSECFYELSIESGVKFVLDRHKLMVPEAVRAVAQAAKVGELELALRAGADFGLVGTVSDPSIIGHLRQKGWPALWVVGRVYAGEGVVIRNGDRETEVLRQGWNYFVKR